MAETVAVLNRSKGRYPVALAGELSCPEPVSSPRWGRPWRLLGVVDEISALGGQMLITSRRVKPPPSALLALTIDDATGLVRPLTLRDEGSRQYLVFEFIALSPELEDLIEVVADSAG